jgi:hypothetical protein
MTDETTHGTQAQGTKEQRPLPIHIALRRLTRAVKDSGDAWASLGASIKAAFETLHRVMLENRPASDAEV